MSDLVGNPEERFSHNEAHTINLSSEIPMPIHMLLFNLPSMEITNVIFVESKVQDIVRASTSVQLPEQVVVSVAFVVVSVAFVVGVACVVVASVAFLAFVVSVT